MPSLVYVAPQGFLKFALAFLATPAAEAGLQHHSLAVQQFHLESLRYLLHAEGFEVGFGGSIGSFRQRQAPVCALKVEESVVDAYQPVLHGPEFAVGREVEHALCGYRVNALHVPETIEVAVRTAFDFAGHEVNACQTREEGGEDVS